MPRIRKKTSKRVTTHKRAKIKHKIAEGRKKNKKKAKKNPQWKSKTKKDPGIPNEFPYKDQILAEVAEARRQAEEAKRLRKEEKKAAREGLLVRDEADLEDVSMKESSSSNPQLTKAPLLLSPDLPNLKAVLGKADVVLGVLDARDPIPYRLSHLIDLVSNNQKSKLVFVLNKIDLVPRETLIAWTKHLRTQQTTFMFRSASAFLPKAPVNDTNAKGKAKETPSDAIGAEALLEHLQQHADVLQTDTLQVAVVGITNTGKSAIINSLARRAAVPVYTPTPSTDAWSTTTSRALEVLVETAGHKINFIDTPGVSLHNGQAHDDALKIRDMLLRSRGRLDKLKDPVPAVDHIVSRADTMDLMVQYNLPAFATGDTTAFLAGLARAHALLKKGGNPDAAQAARIVLRDWTSGRLPFYTEAPAVEGALEGDPLAELYGRADAAALAAARTRKEMRRGAGLVRITPGTEEKRQVELDVLFVGDASDENERGEGESTDDDDEEVDEDADDVKDDGDGGEDDDEDEDEDKDKDEDEDEEEEDIPAPSLRGKRKRTVKTGRPSKKVAFAPGTLDREERKQARRAKSGKDSKPPLKDAKTNARTKAPQHKAAKSKAKPKATTQGGNAYDFDQFFK